MEDSSLDGQARLNEIILPVPTTVEVGQLESHSPTEVAAEDVQQKEGGFEMEVNKIIYISHGVDNKTQSMDNRESSAAQKQSGSNFDVSCGSPKMNKFRFLRQSREEGASQYLSEERIQETTQEYESSPSEFVVSHSNVTVEENLEASPLLLD